MSTSNTNNSKLGDYFLCSPKCNADGSNWVIYCDRFIFAVEAAGLQDYLSEMAVPTSKPSVADASNVTSTEKAAIETWEKTMKIWTTESAVIKQGIASTLPDSLFLKIKSETLVGKMWKSW